MRLMPGEIRGEEEWGEERQRQGETEGAHEMIQGRDCYL